MAAAVLKCKACEQRMVVLLDQSTELLKPHPYVFACPWCGRLTRATLEGVMLRVERADEKHSDDCSEP
jgi:transcription elongation factor Elf1